MQLKTRNGKQPSWGRAYRKVSAYLVPCSTISGPNIPNLGGVGRWRQPGDTWTEVAFTGEINLLYYAFKARSNLR